MRLQYPYNIVRQLKIELLTDDVKDIEKALEYAMDTELTLYEKELLLLKYKEYYTFKQLSDKFGSSVNQMSNTTYRCLNRIGVPKYINYISYGYDKYVEILNKRKKVVEKLGKQSEEINKENVWETDIRILGLNARGYNALKRAGIDTIGELLYFIQKQGLHWKKRVRDLGEKTAYEVWDVLVQKGYASGTMLNPQTISLDENVPSEKPKKETVSVFEKIKLFNEEEYAQWVVTDGMNMFLTCNSMTDVLSYIRKPCEV